MERLVFRRFSGSHSGASGDLHSRHDAMKMQNIIRAERDGIVKSVGFKAGDSVAADDVLAELA